MKHLFALIFLVFLSHLSYSQHNETSLYIDAKSGLTEEILIESAFLPQVQSYDNSVTDSLGFDPVAVGTNLYKLEFTSQSSFTGNTNAVIEYFATTSAGIPVSQFVKLNLAVKSSKISTKPDYVLISGNTPIILDPLANDSSTDGELVITKLGYEIGGSAVIVNNQIEITPSANQGELLYFVQDSSGNISSSKIKFESEDAEVIDSRTVYTDNKSEIEIRLSSSDFELSQSPTQGTITASSATHVWIYTPNTNYNGTDNLVFISTSGGEIAYSIVVLPKSSTSSFIVDDKVYTLTNNTVEFNVLSNDLKSNSTIVYHSPELTQLSNGLFSYTPENGFQGDKVFVYKVLSGTSILTGYINIHIGDFAPINEANYAFDIIENQLLSIKHQSPVTGYDFEIATDPTHGSVTILDAFGQIINECDTIEGEHLIVYIPNEGYTGTDEFDIAYCTGSNSCGEIVKVDVNIVSSSYTDCVCTSDCVFSGDHNDDGRVDIKDILDLGLNIGHGGYIRTNDITGIWTGQHSSNWGFNQVSSGIDLKCGDSDGDGYVTLDDLNDINTYYANSSRFQSSPLTTLSNVPVSFIAQNIDIDSGEVLFIDVSVGNLSNPALDLSGLSFSLSINAEAMDSASVAFNLIDNAWISYNNHAESYAVVPEDGNVDIAISRLGQSSADGYGIVGVLEFIIEDEIMGLKRAYSETAALSAVITNITSVNEYGEYVQHPDQTLEIPIRAGDNKNKEDITFEDNIQVYPNPTNGLLTLKSDIDLINKVEIFDVTGRIVNTINFSAHNIRSLDMSGLNEGIYIFKIYGEQYNCSKKIIKL